MDAQTTCRDFMQAAPADQDAAVDQVASEAGAANAVTPLGRPNVDYLCTQDPEMTLGEAVELTG